MKYEPLIEQLETWTNDLATRGPDYIPQVIAGMRQVAADLTREGDVEKGPIRESTALPEAKLVPAHEHTVDCYGPDVPTLTCERPEEPHLVCPHCGEAALDHYHEETVITRPVNGIDDDGHLSIDGAYDCDGDGDNGHLECSRCNRSCRIPSTVDVEWD